MTLIKFSELPDQIQNIFKSNKKNCTCFVRVTDVVVVKYYIKTTVPKETTVFHYVPKLGWQHLRSY